MKQLQRVSTLCLLGIALVACSRNPDPEYAPDAAAAPAVSGFDPVGFYDFTATLGIEDRTGTLEITRDANGGLGGEAWLDGEGDPAVIESGAVTGNNVQLLARVGGSNEVTFNLDFTGSSFEGTITAGGDQTIAVSGQRRAQ